MPAYPLLAAILLLMPAAAADPAPAQPWELVGSSGWIRMVYIEPSRMKDKVLLSQVVKTLIDQSGGQTPIEIDFFDDREKTPVKLPYEARHKIHQRARYNYNPKNGMKRFQWIELIPVDPNEPTKVRVKLTEETLPSP